MTSAYHFDLIVIGSGPAGHKAAIQGAKAQKRVLLIEKAPTIGGECVRHGTIPSKTLRETAVRYSGLQRRLEGISTIELEPDVEVPSLMSRLGRVVDAHERFLAEQLERNAIERCHGRASFTSPSEVKVENVRGDAIRYTADVFLVAVGSRPRVPDNVAVDHEHILDSDSCLSLQYLPQTLIVLGGGVIACEWASIFAALGVEVTIVDKWPKPLGFLDDEIVKRFISHFETSYTNCSFEGGVELESATWDGVAKVRVALQDGRVIEADKALCALGRVANVGSLDLHLAGVELTSRGHVEVDEFGRTSVPNIYAAGDVVGAPALASTSMAQGRRAARHAFGLPLGSSSDMIPSGLFTIPEIATIGLNPEQAAERFGGAICGSSNFDELARSHINGETDGYLRLVADPDGKKLLGAQVYGEGATDLIHLAQMALIGEMDIDVFIETIFNFPTLSEAYRVAALAIAKQRDLVVAH